MKVVMIDYFLFVLPKSAIIKKSSRRKRDECENRVAEKEFWRVRFLGGLSLTQQTGRFMVQRLKFSLAKMQGALGLALGPCVLSSVWLLAGCLVSGLAVAGWVVVAVGARCPFWAGPRGKAMGRFAGAETGRLWGRREWYTPENHERGITFCRRPPFRSSPTFRPVWAWVGVGGGWLLERWHVSKEGRPSLLGSWLFTKWSTKSVHAWKGFFCARFGNQRVM